MHSLILTGPGEHADAAIDALLGSGYDCQIRPGAVIAYGECPVAAGLAVRRWGWICEDQAEILDGPLELAA